MVKMDACAHVVAQELSRAQGKALCRAYGDADEVRQELLLAAWRASLRHDGRDDLGYIRTAVRNAMKGLGQRARTGMRVPHDQYGRPLALVSIEAAAQDESGVRRLPMAGEGASPEDVAAVRERVALILEQLGWVDRAMLRSAASGTAECSDALLERVRAVAANIA